MMNDEDDIKSKSQKKREADAMQKLGVELIEWPLSKLDTLPLTPQLRQAIIAAKTLKSHGAIRRQAQLIGKLMRNADTEAIMECYQAVIDEGRSKTAAFHQLEQWRDKLIQGGKEALTQYIFEFAPEDVQQLRQLVKKAVDETSTGRPVGALKALFRLMRDNAK